MGQINCQCQYLPQEDTQSLRKSQNLNPSFCTPEAEIASIVTKITLRNSSNIIEIKMKEGGCLQLGTSEDCGQKPAQLNGNSYKVQLKLINHCLYAQDQGMGLGVFVLKKRLLQICDGRDILISLEEYFIRIKIKSNQQILASVYGVQFEETKLMQGRKDHQLVVGQCVLLVRREKQGKQYSIKRLDRKSMWVLLTQSRKIKLHDVLRLGCEFYKVDAITSFIESSRVY